MARNTYISYDELQTQNTTDYITTQIYGIFVEYTDTQF